MPTDGEKKKPIFKLVGDMIIINGEMIPLRKYREYLKARKGMHVKARRNKKRKR